MLHETVFYSALICGVYVSWRINYDFQVRLGLTRSDCALFDAVICASARGNVYVGVLPVKYHIVYRDKMLFMGFNSAEVCIAVAMADAWILSFRPQYLWG